MPNLSGEVKHFRKGFLHWVGIQEAPGKWVGEWHKNYWPTQGLGGLNFIPHGLFESQFFGGFGAQLYNARHSIQTFNRMYDYDEKYY